jgi:hypothetical protein
LSGRIFVEVAYISPATSTIIIDLNKFATQATAFFSVPSLQSLPRQAWERSYPLFPRQYFLLNPCSISLPDPDFHRDRAFGILDFGISDFLVYWYKPDNPYIIGTNITNNGGLR